MVSDNLVNLTHHVDEKSFSYGFIRKYSELFAKELQEKIKVHPRIRYFHISRQCGLEINFEALWLPKPTFVPLMLIGLLLLE